MSIFHSPKLRLHGLSQHRNSSNNTNTCRSRAAPLSLKSSQQQNSSDSSASQQCRPNRRSLLFLSTTATLTLPPPPISTGTTTTTTSPPSQPRIDTTITDRVFLDFSICPTYFRTDQAPDLRPCPDSEPMGRVVLGLYGKLVPITVSNFKAMCSGSNPSSFSYKNGLVHKILPGQYFAAGRQGERREKWGGEFKPLSGLLSQNVEAVDSKAFVLKHSRAGIVSLCLGENDEEEEIKLDPEYRNVEFLITTGPGPCPQLDNRNIVLGAVLEGLDVVRSIASIPTYQPGQRIRQFNDLANLLGDERAKNARTLWNRPLKTVYISDCGQIESAKPSLSPTLP